MMIGPNVAPVVTDSSCSINWVVGNIKLAEIMMLYLLIGRQKEVEMTLDGVFAMEKLFMLLLISL
jgi:hypothetical protein